MSDRSFFKLNGVFLYVTMKCGFRGRDYEEGASTSEDNYADPDRDARCLFFGSSHSHHEGE